MMDGFNQPIREEWAGGLIQEGIFTKGGANGGIEH
jgi:hypothetical protein